MISPVAFVSAVLLAFSALTVLPTSTLAADISTYQSNLERRYSMPHSLGDNYQFDLRDGWQSINVTNLQYKYSRSVTQDAHESSYKKAEDIPARHSKRASKKASKKKGQKTTSKVSHNSTSNAVTKGQSVSDAASGILGSVKNIVDSIKAIGNPEPVTITWYTGHDLLNPSCWSSPTWSPTDESFACALTLDGWADRPKCFKFLELCNTPQKCVFVRVVDSCAGCAPGSKHVDLTKAAFSSLADLAEGVLTVQMRQATDPQEGWLENLWGPKVN
ncbi:hypothetical protein WOLCODRAFT_131799 [Wolfiporia cocos MD-104 SS10]|uniref:RlpA-like protein double-psi beta-barrel domain-containing protein n=1 Tax=Wolfiporia cocos (strain MD-104) TaxID=742152 RepID=A0A2H3JMY4_WOLCO|nr:hypothetical protein WOLCODRAFT_131799 [Wolfiporia cocos MD-104 SS10]